MITNVYPKYEPKTDWENQTKVNMNIRDLQGKYPNGCQCCGNISTTIYYRNTRIVGGIG